MNAGRALAAREIAWQRAFVSEIFHNLSQPLTALHCSLDLALRRGSSLEQLRTDVQAALEATEHLRQRLLQLRELNDALDPGDTSLTDLAEFLRRFCDDMQPLFDSGGQRFELQVEPESIMVRVNAARIERAMFRFFVYLLRYAAHGSVLKMKARRHGNRAEICIDTDSPLPVPPSDEGSPQPYSCEIELLRRTFRAAEGDFCRRRSSGERSTWCGHLPLAGS